MLPVHMTWNNNKIYIEPDKGIVSKYYIVIDQNFVHSYRNSVDLRLRKGFVYDLRLFRCSFGYFCCKFRSDILRLFHLFTYGQTNLHLEPRSLFNCQ